MNKGNGRAFFAKKVTGMPEVEQKKVKRNVGPLLQETKGIPCQKESQGEEGNGKSLLCKESKWYSVRPNRKIGEKGKRAGPSLQRKKSAS